MTPEPELAAEQAIPGTATPTLFADVEHLEEIDSTNRYLVDAALAGAPEGRAVVAARQSAGRGRLGRRWLDAPGGSLLCSVLFRPPWRHDRWHLALWCVAVGARRAIREVTGVETSFKWPNDLLAGERKVAGVLGELAPPSGLVVGIGINCNWPPDWPPEELAASATSLDRETGAEIDLDALERAFLAATAEEYGRLRGAGAGAGAGARAGAQVTEAEATEAEAADAFAALASRYRSHLSTVGRLVSVELTDETFVGRALDVDDRGRLLVDVGACVRLVEAGDVVHVRSPGPAGTEG